MRHVPTNSAFPDIVEEWAAEEVLAARVAKIANDNGHAAADELSDPLLALVARAEIEATRLW